MPAGGDVGRLGADPERHGDLSGLVAGCLGVGQGGQAGAYPVPAGVDLQRPETVLGGPFAFRGHPVVPERGAHRVVTQQLLQRVDRGAGVGVALGEGVPERVREHQLAGEWQELAVGAALDSVETGQGGDPGSHGPLQVRGGDGPGAVGVLQRPGEQRQVFGGRAGERGPDPGLLGGDDGRFPVVDRQPAAGLADLGHVVHEHRAGPALAVVADVLVVVQAGEVKRAQLGGAPARHRHRARPPL